MPSAFLCHFSRPSFKVCPPLSCEAKSITRVVPPRIAALVPVSKSSAVTVPATSRSKWECPSINPGKRSLPDTSTTLASGCESSFPTFMIFSPSTNTSCFLVPAPDITVPFFKRYFIQQILPSHFYGYLQFPNQSCIYFSSTLTCIYTK